ncbi:hypothetical protein DRQ21_06365 [Candidatus Fermentibacteria bacterium]|nr:MAG: hypothetical protein DRQ21_06365 [Candidatus Fermentibacteria bacterium]
MKKDISFLRAVIILASAGLTLVFAALFNSRSTSGVIAGKWSFQMGIVLLVVLTAWITTAVLFSRESTVRKRLSPVASRIPEFAAGLLTVLLPLLFFTVWFLFPVPILQRRSFVAGAALLSLVPGLTVTALYKPPKLKSTLGSTAVMVFSFVLAAVLSEVVLHNIMPQSIFNPRFGLRPYQNVELEVDLPGISPGGTLSTNMWGLRGEDPPQQWEQYFTIVTVGGSTTANYYLDDNLTWSSIVQSELRKTQPATWVGNGGIPRHSADTHLLFVREVLSKIKPDMALFLTGVNDMGPFLRGAAAEEERLPDSGLRQVLFSHSMLLQLIYKLKVVYIDGAPVITRGVDPYFQEIPMNEPETPLPDDLHDILEDPDFYRCRIRALIQECRSMNITPVFMTQPLLYENNDHWRGVLEGSRWLGGSAGPMSAATFSLMLTMLNQDLMQVCSEEGVAVFDLASEVPHTREYFYDSMHMTEAGARLVGEKAADFLLERREMLWPED